MTNGNKIRAMNDVDLAYYIAGEVLRLEGARLAVAAEAWYWIFRQEARE